jgi:hypothetical protein
MVNLMMGKGTGSLSKLPITILTLNESSREEESKQKFQEYLYNYKRVTEQSFHRPERSTLSRRVANSVKATSAKLQKS